jgi:hypothetical protein
VGGPRHALAHPRAVLQAATRLPLGAAAIEAALALRREHGSPAETIARVRIESFAEAVALGSQCPRPQTTDEAQYSITYPVAARWSAARGVRGPFDAGPAERAGRRAIERMRAREAPALSRCFPGQALTRAVRLTLRDGRELVSGDTVARGSAENPLDDGELAAKYPRACRPVLGAARPPASSAPCTRCGRRAGARVARRPAAPPQLGLKLRHMLERGDEPLPRTPMFKRNARVLRTSCVATARDPDRSACPPRAAEPSRSRSPTGPPPKAPRGRRSSR